MDSTSTLDEPTTDLTASLAATNTDRCPNCGTRMAPDQRYCIACGERRSGGGLRDAMPRAQAAAAPPATVTRTRAWLSPNNSLIAGIATLLLAMGVGVLIGRSGNDNGGHASTPQVVTVAAPAAGAATAAGSGAATTTAGTTSSSSTSSKSTKKKSSSSSKAKVTGAGSVDEVAKKNGVKLPPKVVKVGQKCASGAKGCQNGKFTGNFFGGG
jgi:hypothetical protein